MPWPVAGAGIPLRLAPSLRSLYLPSALLVLVGSYLRLHDRRGLPITVELGEVFGTYLAYQAMLLLAALLLHRVRREEQDVVVVLAILALFLADAPLLQHLYGWAAGDGLRAAFLGALAALATLAVLVRGLQLPVTSRLVGVSALTVLFVRFGPCLLRGASGDAVAARHVALGWLLATLPLAAWLRPTARPGARLRLALLERGGLLLFVGLAVLHFVLAGRGLDLAFHPLYLAPLVVLAAPALEQVAPELRLSRSARLLLGGLPYLGLALAATSFPPGLLGQRWAQAWPLTPFYLTLLLTAAVELHRGRRDGNPARRHLAALLAALACLGGDVPEMLTRARFPALWQVVAVALVAWVTIARSGRPALNQVLAGLSAFVLASWLAEIRSAFSLARGDGYPWVCAFLVVLAWSGLLLEQVTGWLLTPRARLVLAGVATLIPVGVLLLAPGTFLGPYLAAATVVAALLIGLLRRDAVLRQVATVAAAAVVVLYPLAFQLWAEVSLGRLLTQLGFVLFLAGLANTLYGSGLRQRWRIWWHVADPARQPLGRRP